MKRQYIDKKKPPENPGVYIFRDSQKRPLYIGRATILRDRVKSYFSNDLIDTRGPRIVDMVTKAKTLTWQETDSVLEAIILESNLIKRYQPYYNVDERDDKSSLYVVITGEAWPRVFLERAREFEQKLKDGEIRVFPGELGSSVVRNDTLIVKKYFGPFPHTGLIKEALKILRKLFPFRDKKAHDARHESFYRSLGMSPQTESEEARASYQKTIDYLILFFEGKKRKLQKAIEAEMSAKAKEMRFEQAQIAKKLLYAISHVNDIALIKRDPNKNAERNFRIEAYDVAHLSGMATVGAMTVSIGGQAVPSEYRKFKMSRDQVNDVAGLVEILSRRLNHSEWAYPDMIVVDGNEVISRSAEAVLRSRRISIPIIAVTKDERHKAARLSGNPELIKAYKDEIIAVNVEAHRFALAFHRLRRSRR